MEELPPASVEQHFVYCILEETLSHVCICALIVAGLPSYSNACLLKKIGNVLPQDVCNEPDSKLPAVQKNQNLVDLLKLKVARLIDDP